LVKRTLATAVGITTIVVGSASAADLPRGLSLKVARASLQRELTATTKGAPVLGGFTSQGGPVVLALSRNAKRLRLAETALIMKCTSGNGFVAPEEAFGLAIKPNGRVHITSTTSFTDAAGDSVKQSHSFGATINRKRWTASGAWRLHMSITTPDGHADSCDSGNVGFRAQL
jgi:hypothetical protein